MRCSKIEKNRSEQQFSQGLKKIHNFLGIRTEDDNIKTDLRETWCENINQNEVQVTQKGL
jgi:hypothetical protein